VSETRLSTARVKTQACQVTHLTASSARTGNLTPPRAPIWNLALVAPVIDRLRRLEPFHGNLKPSFLVELAYRLFRLPAGFLSLLTEPVGIVF
jgi:hypothetical protein